jgi:hypothetical protein
MDAGSTDEKLRAARNQVLYREVNEKVADLNKAFDYLLSLSGSWVCECADERCTEQMELTLAEYEELRQHPNRFAVLPGHVLEDVERIVEEHPGYVVVEKFGAAATSAVEHDPRNAQSTS